MEQDAGLSRTTGSERIPSGGGPPAGTLTMLLTDVEGSTVLWETHRVSMRTAIRRHHDLAFAAVERHNGYRPPDQGEGDSIFAVFTDPVAAVSCALDLQRALTAEPWPDGVELRVRAALHTGPSAVALV